MVYSVTKYGAVGDGATNDAAAIQSAIDLSLIHIYWRYAIQRCSCYIKKLNCGIHVVAAGKQFHHSSVLLDLDLVLVCSHANQCR